MADQICELIEIDGVLQQRTREASPDEQAEIDARRAAPLDRAAALGAIDDAVADIYGRYTRFDVEYAERELQARDFKAAGYTGAVPPRVADFATPAGMDPAMATDRIIGQADALRAAMGELSALRMRKYEVLRAGNDAVAREVHGQILAAIAHIGASLN